MLASPSSFFGVKNAIAEQHYCSPSRLGQIPDWRRPGAFLNGFRDAFSGLDTRSKRIPGRPSTYRIFQYTRIVKGTLIGVELRISPMCFEFPGASTSCNTAISQIHLRIIVRATMGRGVNLPTIGTSHVENFFLNLAFCNPTLDDLRPLQRCAQRITKCPNDKRRCSIRLGHKVCAHRHSTRIGLTNQILAID